MAPRGRTTNLTRLAAPDGIMPMARSNKRMSNFMKNRVTDMVVLGMTNIVPRQRNSAVCIIALAGTPTRMVELDRPSVKAVMAHKLGGRFQRRLKRPVSRLHAAPAI